jgi:hypothetical protein
MDEAVQRFRRQAGRELGDREGAERRYSLGLRQQAVAYWRAREAAGDGVRVVATALGIAPVSLRRLAEDVRFRPVRLLAEAPARAPVGLRRGLHVDTLDAHAHRVDDDHEPVAALFHTLCESAKLVGVDPHTYLTYRYRGRARDPGHGHAPRRRRGVIPSSAMPRQAASSRASARPYKNPSSR